MDDRPISQSRSSSHEETNGHSSVNHAASSHDLKTAVSAAMGSARDWLLARQDMDGSWCAELEGDTILESEYILLLAFSGRLHESRAKKAAAYLLQKQLPQGGWSLFPGGDLEISASVKAYFALKLTGHDPESEPLRRARGAILARGGADAVNSFTRFYLALLGQIPYSVCPAVPPELVLLPRWFPINLYKMSSWTRTIVVPLSIFSAHEPVCQVPAAQGIQELFIKPPKSWPAPRSPGADGSLRQRLWHFFFRSVNRGCKLLQRLRCLPLRKRAIRRARDWMLARFQKSDGLGAIFPPMIFSVIALKCLGYADDSPELEYCWRKLQGLEIETPDSLRLQPCLSPVWDTAIALRALFAAGDMSQEPHMEKAVRWLLDHEVQQAGDWRLAVSDREVPIGGWYFEYANEFYPDLDDTAMVVMALQKQFAPSAMNSLEPGDDDDELGALRQENTDLRARQKQSLRTELLGQSMAAIDRAERWMIGMQNRDGGWGAFDKNNDREFLCHVPFADHNAMIDPSTPDLAARVIEALGHLGKKVGNPAVDRAVSYLRKTQEPDGAWFGRWGVNYVYGTWQALTGLAAVGVPASDPMMQRGAAWLLKHQQPCGGWGESCRSYDDPNWRGKGNVTPSQTAWGILGLLAAGDPHPRGTRRGIQFLLESQSPTGDWCELEFTGTGFPRVFYLRYHYYRVYFPLLALARWNQWTHSETDGELSQTTDSSMPQEWA